MIIKLKGNVQQVVKPISKFAGKKAEDVLEWPPKLRVSLSLYRKSISNIIQGSQRPSKMDNNQAITRKAWDDVNHYLYSIFYFTIISVILYFSHWYSKRGSITLITKTCDVVVFLTLTDPLRIQPWSQDRRNQTKSNRESEISRESRHKRTDKKVASKGHRRDEIETQTKTHRQ